MGLLNLACLGTLLPRGCVAMRRAWPRRATRASLDSASWRGPPRLAELRIGLSGSLLVTWDPATPASGSECFSRTEALRVRPKNICSAACGSSMPIGSAAGRSSMPRRTSPACISNESERFSMGRAARSPAVGVPVDIIHTLCVRSCSSAGGRQRLLKTV